MGVASTNIIAYKLVASGSILDLYDDDNSYLTITWDGKIYSSGLYEDYVALSSKYAALAGNQAVAFSCSDLQSYGQVDVIGTTYSVSLQTAGIYSVFQGENMITFDHVTPKLTTWAIDAVSLSENGVSLATKYALKAGSSSQAFNCSNLTAYGSVAATSLSAGGSGGSSLTGTTLTIGGLAVS